MYKEIKNERPIQFKRIKERLMNLSEYYKTRGVYNRYYSIINGNFEIMWRRIDYRNSVLAPAIRHARKIGLLKKSD